VGEEDVASFKVLSNDLSGGIEEIYKSIQSGQQLRRRSRINKKGLNSIMTEREQVLDNIFPRFIVQLT
jgi:hypothetical protein